MVTSHMVATRAWTAAEGLSLSKIKPESRPRKAVTITHDSASGREWSTVDESLAVGPCREHLLQRLLERRERHLDVAERQLEGVARRLEYLVVDLAVEHQPVPGQTARMIDA